MHAHGILSNGGKNNGPTVLLTTASMAMYTTDRDIHCRLLCVTVYTALQPGGRAAGAVRAPGLERETGETSA